MGIEGEAPVKELIGKRINRTFHVAKGIELDGVTKAADDTSDDIWGYASVEVEDSAGDIVRIAGIDTDTYHRPPRTYLKILAQHDSSSPTTGEAFIVGRVEEFKRTKTVVDGQIVPALAFRMSWARDGEGNLTPLAKHYKGLFEGGYWDSFSVGMLVKDYETLASGGIDYTATLLYEVSCVSVPANGYANVTSAKDVTSDADDAVLKHVERQQELLGKQVEQVGQLLAQVAEICISSKGLEGAFNAFSADIAKRLEALEDRLDSIEAGIVVKSETHSPKTDDRTRGQAELQKLADITQKLKRFSGV